MLNNNAKFSKSISRGRCRKEGLCLTTYDASSQPFPTPVYVTDAARCSPQQSLPSTQHGRPNGTQAPAHLTHIAYFKCCIQGPTVAANPGGKQLAMSRALGAAFLNHQVEQLEKSVTNGTGTGSWRERERRNPQARKDQSNGIARGGGGGDRGVRRTQPQGRDTKSVKSQTREEVIQNKVEVSRRSHEEFRSIGKDADVIVVDSSVLVHALYQVKKWCKDGRDEIIIVPLEGVLTSRKRSNFLYH